MKKTATIIACTILSIYTYGQIKTNEVSIEETNNLTSIIVPAKPSGEEILHLSVDDAGPDYLKFGNATGTTGQFMPSIRGYHVTDNRSALYMVGMVESANDTGDSPMITFDGRRNGDVLTTRPLFGWDNFGNRKMTLSANGMLGIGTQTPHTLLHVHAPAITGGGENFLKFSVSDATSDYFSIGNATGADNQLMPTIRGYHVSDNRTALYMLGMVEAANDTGDSPVVTFDARRNGATLSSRPLFGWDNYGNRKMTLTAEGKLGVGTETPETTIHVETPGVTGSGERLMKLTVSDASQDYLQFNNATGANNQFIPVVKGYHTSDNRTALYLSGEIAPGNDAGNSPVMIFDARVTGAAVTTRPAFAWTTYSQTRMTMLANGYVGIGRTNPNYQLDVNGSINASSYYNDGTSQWPDYVFKDEYELATLEEVEKHIEEHGHLENIPSEKEVLENGYNMGELDTKLLEKVEELTLYLIEVNKKLEAQNQRIEALEEENKLLKDQSKP